MGSPFALKHRRNPVSMALHSSLAPCEIPSVSSLRDKASKVGQLKKLSGKGILTSGTWRNRFCLLVKSKLYYYESQDSTGTDKSCGFVNLEYFDTCTEASTRMARKATNVFVIGSSDKGFFESHSGRHYFAAETLTEMKEWVNAINTAMNHIRNKEKRTTRDGSLTPGPKTRDSSKMKSKGDDSPTGTLPRTGARLDHVTKGRVKGPQGRRLPRKPQKLNGTDSKSEAVDSLVDSEDDAIVRDSRGRATSLSALEASSETHPKVSLEKEVKRSHSQTQPENGTNDFWGSPRGIEIDAVDTQELDLIYHYTSSDDSDDENDNILQPVSSNDSRKSSLFGKSGNFIQNRPHSRAGNGTLRGPPSRNSSVTPPPCVLRKYRREQMNNNCNGSSAITETKKVKDNGREESPSPLLPEFDIRPQRTSSGSSLSTLTADTYSHISNSSHEPFSSLQRNGRRMPSFAGAGFNGNGNTMGKIPQNVHRNTGFQNPRPSSSANASPLMNGSNGLVNVHSSLHRNGYSSQNNSHNSSPCSTFERDSYGGGKGFQIERNLYSVTKELESVTQETKQLDIDVTGLRQDVGTVQENIVTVRGAVDCTRDRVNKLQNQVLNIERQVASIMEEATSMREQARELLESAQQTKETHENLLEEAQNLVGFLRQSTNFMPTSPYLHQHPFGHYQPNCFTPSPCGTPIPPYYGHNGQPPHPMTNSQQPVSLRRQSKNPANTLDTDDADMETLNESVIHCQNQNGYAYDSISSKNRKSKSLLSNGSSGSNSSSSNRVSVIETFERKPGSRSPNADGKLPNDVCVKVSHL